MLKRIGLTLSAALLTTSASLSAEDFQPWHAFGEETVGVVNFPQSPDLIELSARTKAHQLFDFNDLMERFAALFKEEQPEFFAKAEEQLNAVGLEWADFATLLTGPMGAGMQVFPPREDGDEPSGQLIAWLTPGEGETAKFVEAIAAALEMQTEPEERRITRVDYELEGMTLMHFNGPSISSQMVVEDDGTTIVEDIPTTGDQPVFLLVRDGGRFYMALQEQADDNEVDRNRLVSFIQSVKAETPNSFAEKVQNSTYVNAQLPDGLSAMEMFLDPRPFLKLIPEPANSFSPSPAQVMNAMGLDAIEMLAVRSTMSEGMAKLGMVIETDGPLTGLLGILNQDAVDPVFPDWIPADVVDAQKINLDLSKVYASIQSMVRRIVGDQAEAGFQQANMGATMYLGMDLPSLFAALGETHYFVTYPTDDDEILADENLEQMEFGDPMAGQSNRIGWVQEVRNPEGASQFMTGLMNTMNMFAAPAEAVEEQGFTGWRLAMPELGSFEVSMMLGQGQLMAGFDEFSSTHTLNYLVNPPEAEARLNTDPAIPALKEHLPEGDMIAFTYQHTGKAMREASLRMKAMFDLMETSFPSGVDDDEVRGYSLGIGLIKSFIPSPEDVEAAWGKALSAMKAGENGFSVNVVMELPLADL